MQNAEKGNRKNYFSTLFTSFKILNWNKYYVLVSSLVLSSRLVKRREGGWSVDKVEEGSLVISRLTLVGDRMTNKNKTDCLPWHLLLRRNIKNCIFILLRNNIILEIVPTHSILIEHESLHSRGRNMGGCWSQRPRPAVQLQNDDVILQYFQHEQ